MNSDQRYGLTRPTIDDAHAAVLRVHGPDGPRVWQQLLDTAGLHGQETGEESFTRLTAVMAAAGPTTRLCALALNIRATSYLHLSAAHTLTQEPA
jgi:hypothetical protein